MGAGARTPRRKLAGARPGHRLDLLMEHELRYLTSTLRAIELSSSFEIA